MLVMFPVKEEPPGYSAASGASCTESESDAVGIEEREGAGSGAIEKSDVGIYWSLPIYFSV